MGDTAPYGEDELCGKWFAFKKEEERDPAEEDNGVSPEECNAVSRVMMWWMTPLIFGGLGRDVLQGVEAPKLPACFKVENVAPRAKEAWKVELEYSKQHSKDPSMFRILWSMWKPILIKGLLWSMLQGLLSTVVKPLLLLLLIDSLDSKHVNETQVYYVAGLSVTLIAEGIATSTSRQYFNDRFGTAYLITCSSLLHWKAHTASTLESNEKAILGSDIIKTYESFKQLCLLPMSCFSIIGGVIMLYVSLGWVCSFGLAIVVSILVLTLYLAHVTKGVEHKALNAADERISITTRIIEGIKAIKYCAWEQNFLDTVIESRNVESVYVQKTRMLHMAAVQLGRSSPILAAACTFIALALLGDELNPANIFAGLTIFQSLRLALTSTPIGITLSATLDVSLKRLASYLAAPGVEARPRCEEGVHMEGAKFTWGDSFTLNIQKMEAKAGTLTAVVGQVGNGKTSLLSAILGDMPLKEGIVKAASDDIGYAPQRAFVACGSIKNNILMGREYNGQRFYNAVVGAALDADLDILPAGAETAIGERGITLSGGQQQRVSVARALYSEPKVLVLDDPLAAVDSSVAARIFDSLKVYAHEKGCCVIVSLNQLHFLPEVDQVLVLSNGTLAEQGTYSTVMESEGVLHKFVQQSEQILTASQSRNQAPGMASSLPLTNTEDEKKTAASLFRSEKNDQGEISDSVYMEYVRSMGTVNITLGLLFCQLGYLSMGFSDRWLALWIKKDTEYHDEKDLKLPGPMNHTSPDVTLYAPVYGGGCILLVVCLIISSYFFSKATMQAGRTLHNQVLDRLLHAPVAWYQETPSGRIISRLSSDLSTVDNFLSQFFEHSIGFAATILVLFTIMIIVVPPVAIVLVFTTILYVFQIKAADATNRDLKRLSNHAMGPVLTGMAETTNGQGRAVLRVMDFSASSERAFGYKLDLMARYSFLSAGVIAWQNMWCYAVATLISTCTSIYMIWGPSSFSSSELGLALTYCFLLPYFLLYFSFTFSVMRICMTSLERLLHYKGEDVTQEPAWHKPSDHPSWPSKGDIRFEDVSLVYREGLPPALKNITMDIKAGERIGVVGRTGAGKSSLAVVLFRLVDVTGGRVVVDGEDIKTTGLQCLRKRMGMIPQEPLLMIGTVRTNLDPFSEHTDEEVASALQRVGLGNIGMTTEVGAGADTLSSGQRQLLSLARTLLRDVKVMVMDEPTSSIDPVTDATIQRVIRNEFSQCTVITIAHRLHTIIDSDRVLVMSKGEVAEFGPPQQLMTNPQSHLSSMVADLDRSIIR